MSIRKSISSFFVLLAYAVIFCHGMVPHHHHHSPLSLQHTGDEDGDHDGDDADQGFWARAFALFHHEGGTQITYQPAQESVQAPVMSLEADALVPQRYDIQIAERPRALYGAPEAVIIQHSFFFPSCLRRGPPCA